MIKIAPYLRPIIIIIFGLIIWFRQLDTFVDAWVIRCICFVYGFLRAYLVYRKRSDNKF